MEKKIIRILDITISTLFLIIIFPLILLICFLIFFIDGRPIIYKQERIGIYGKKFQIFKFRTMSDDISIKNKLRLTNLGKILRRLSLDEIPQFLNVLKADMSIVGPRPLPELYEKKINSRLKILRRKILPGITGMSQIRYTGRYRKLEEKVRLDIDYVKNYSLYNYTKVLFYTPYVLMIRLLKNKSSIIN